MAIIADATALATAAIPFVDIGTAIAAAAADTAAAVADALAITADAAATTTDLLADTGDVAAGAATAAVVATSAPAAAADATAESADLAATPFNEAATAADLAFDAAAGQIEIVQGYAQTQSLSITDQLNAGIRSLDIRGTLVDDTININSQQFYTGLTLQDVLNECTAFLQANPSETIVISLRSNENPGGPVNSSNNFATDLNTLLSSFDPAVTGKQTYNNFMYYSSSPNTIPDLGQVRGKIVIIPYASQWQPTPTQSGTVLGWNATEVDDDFTVSDPAARWNDSETQTSATTAGLNRSTQRGK